MVQLSPAARRFRRRRLAVLIVVLVVLTPAAVGVGHAAARGGWGSSFVGEDTHGPLSWFGLALTVVGLVVETWGAIRLFRARKGKSRWESPLLGLSREGKRGLRDQMRGRRPADAESLPMVRLLAQTTVREYGNFAPVLAGLMVMQIGQLLTRELSAVGLLMVAALIMMAIGLAVSLVDVQRARNFLLAHPEQGTDRAGVR